MGRAEVVLVEGWGGLAADRGKLCGVAHEDETAAGAHVDIAEEVVEKAVVVANH